MTRLELFGLYAIVAVALVAVAVLAWQLLRPSKVPPRVVTEWKTIDERHDWDGEQAATYARMLGLPSHHVQVFDGKQLRGVEDFAPGTLIPVDGDPRDLAFHMERPEPVRESFRRMLEGGPDYYHQEV